MVIAINDEQETSMMVERHAEGVVELAITIASLINTNRKCDAHIIHKAVHVSNQE